MLQVPPETQVAGATSTRPGLMRSGTGVIFNNTVSGYDTNAFSIDGQRENTASCLVNTAPLGKCDGSNAYDGNTEASGWPCIGQIGRGAVSGWNENGGTLSATPLYGWKNGTTSTCVSGGTCNNTVELTPNACGAGSSDYWKTTGSTHANGDVDYINNGDTPKPGYTAYTYPHPLQGAVAGSGAGLRGSKGIGLF